MSERNNTDTPSNAQHNTSSTRPMTIIVISLLLVSMGAVAFFFAPIRQLITGNPDNVTGSSLIDFKNITFVDLPEILINLRTADGRSTFLKAQFTVECLTPESAHKIERIGPLLLDQFQVYLRELDLEDIRGSAGLLRIRQELINRANAIIAPERISNILFKEFLIQ